MQRDFAMVLSVTCTTSGDSRRLSLHFCLEVRSLHSAAAAAVTTATTKAAAVVLSLPFGVVPSLRLERLPGCCMASVALNA